MSCPPQFPSTSSIPPAEFYNIHGLANWLNQNDQYKQYFVGTFPFILPPERITSTLSTLEYDPKHVPLCSDVTTLSQEQAFMYNQQIALFRRVYGFNSNAYVNYVCGNNTRGPIYYTFKDYQELTQYKSAAALVNKLYPFRAMANASTLNWQTPFPVLM